MRKPNLSAGARRWLIWIGVFGICAGIQLEYVYRDRVAQLPQLVDQNGQQTASLEAAMAGLDAYQHAKNLRLIGHLAIAIGAVLSALGIFATVQSYRQK